MKNPIYVENILSSIKSNDLSLISSHLDEQTVISYSSNKLTSFLSFFCNCKGKEKILKSKKLEKESIKQINTIINSTHHVDRVVFISVTISYEHIESKKKFSLNLFNEIILDSSIKIKEWKFHGDFYNVYDLFKYELENKIIESVSINHVMIIRSNA